MSKKAKAHPKPKPITLHLKAWRKHRGLTQEQFAERIGMTGASISRIEKGQQNWDSEFLAAAADVLRCEPRDLVMRDPSDPAGIWSLWDTLPAAQKDQAVAVIQALKLTGTDS